MTIWHVTAYYRYLSFVPDLVVLQNWHHFYWKSTIWNKWMAQNLLFIYVDLTLITLTLIYCCVVAVLLTKIQHFLTAYFHCRQIVYINSLHNFRVIWRCAFNHRTRDLTLCAQPSMTWFDPPPSNAGQDVTNSAKALMKTLCIWGNSVPQGWKSFQRNCVKSWGVYTVVCTWFTGNQWYTEYLSLIFAGNILRKCFLGITYTVKYLNIQIHNCKLPIVK